MSLRVSNHRTPLNGIQQLECNQIHLRVRITRTHIHHSSERLSRFPCTYKYNVLFLPVAPGAAPHTNLTETKLSLKSYN